MRVKYLTSCLLILVLFAGCSSSSINSRYGNNKKTSKSTYSVYPDTVLTLSNIPSADRHSFNDLRDAGSVVSYLKGFLGVPYKYGGETKKGIDCSGLTSSVYKKLFGKLLPRSAKEQYNFGRKVAGKGNLKFLDLVFFKNKFRYKFPEHVGLYLYNGYFMHASSKRGVIISSLNSSYYKKRFIGGRRVLD